MHDKHLLHFRLKSLKAEIKKGEKLQSEKAKRKAELQQKRKKQAHKLGQLKYPFRTIHTVYTVHDGFSHLAVDKNPKCIHVV